MKFVFTGCVLLCLSAFTLAGEQTTIEIPSESFTVKGKLRNVELTDQGGVVTVSGVAGKYGRVFITYKMKPNPNSPSQGCFTGRGFGIDDEGKSESATRQGVWKREGTKYTMLSLDDLTDGTQNLCKSILDVATEEFEMTFYPMP
ncbi:MAG: hypothetical protein P8N76_23060 [Pirellulaceae bacterium]|nr:hypothetical protein [Pirellulaceae bacterium]